MPKSYQRRGPCLTGRQGETATATPIGVTPQPGTGEDTGAESTTPRLPDGQVEATAKRRVKRFSVRGAVPVENYGELFRCFVGPAARMNLKRLHLGIHFEMEVPEGQALDPNDPALKAMKEAARQQPVAESGDIALVSSAMRRP